MKHTYDVTSWSTAIGHIQIFLLIPLSSISVTEMKLTVLRSDPVYATANLVINTMVVGKYYGHYNQSLSISCEV